MSSSPAARGTEARAATASSAGASGAATSACDPHAAPAIVAYDLHAAVASSAGAKDGARCPKLIFVGGGRLAGVLYSLFRKEYEILGYVDDFHPKGDAYLTATYGLPCLGSADALPALAAAEPRMAAVVAITDAAARKKYGELLTALGLPLATLVAPTAVVDEHASLGPGCIIRHQAVIGPQTKLGANCVVSDNAYVAHDCIIGAHTYISPGVNINGSVVIGEAAFLGTGAVVIPERRIGSGCIIGAAACVTKDVPDGLTVVGVPARPLESKKGPGLPPEPAPPDPDPVVPPDPGPQASPAPPTSPAPLVSILLTSYNHGRFVGEAIRSALDQRFGDFELVVVDDASTDNSLAVIQSFADPRLRVTQHERNLGIGPTKSEAFARARGTYVAILNSDDAWLPDKLEKQLEVFAQDPGLAAVFTAVQVIDEDGAPFRNKRHFYYDIFEQPNRSRHEWLNYFFHHGNCLCAPSALLHRERVVEVGGFHDKRLRQLGDLDLWVRLCLRYPIWIHPERLTRFRVLHGETNASGAEIGAQERARWEYCRLLRHYLRIESQEELLAVFPEAERFVASGPPLDPTGIAFVIAQLVLERPTRHRQLFALETLFQLFADEETAAQLEQRFGFSYRQLADLAGQFDLFGLGESNLAEVRLRRRIGRLLARVKRPRKDAG